MRRTALLLPALLVVAGNLVACNSGFSSGVDGSKPASTLTPAEARTSCESFDAYLQDNLGGSEGVRIDCDIRALSTMTDPEGCEAADAACLAAPPADRTFEIHRLDCTDAMADPTCNAPVSDLESCITATLDAYQQRFDRLDCAIAGNIPELQALQEPLPSPEACAALSSTCPSFAGGAFGD